MLRKANFDAGEDSDLLEDQFAEAINLPAHKVGVYKAIGMGNHLVTMNCLEKANRQVQKTGAIELRIDVDALGECNHRVNKMVSDLGSISEQCFKERQKSEYYERKYLEATDVHEMDISDFVPAPMIDWGNNSDKIAAALDAFSATSRRGLM